MNKEKFTVYLQQRAKGLVPKDAAAYAKNYMREQRAIRRNLSAYFRGDFGFQR